MPTIKKTPRLSASREKSFAHFPLSIVPSQSGFTLIELMITIAIIGILFAVIITSTLGVKKSSRDAQRQSDLRSIQSALEQYNADQTYYPCSVGAGCTSALNLTTSAQLTNTTGTPTVTPAPSARTYLNKIPTDPTSGQNYKYTGVTNSGGGCDNSSTNCNNYCLYWQLESSPAPSSTPSTCPQQSPYNFILSQP